MSERNAVHRGFDRFGMEAGAEKQSGGWYWRSDELLAVVDLQKSQYGPTDYVNVGVLASRQSLLGWHREQRSARSVTGSTAGRRR